MSYAVQHNLPIFPKKQVFPVNGKYYISASLGYETYLGIMNTTPRKDYFAFVSKFNEKEGQFKIGRLDSMDVMKRIKKNEILIEVIPNRYGGIVDMTEFVPRMKSGYLLFTTQEVEMSFFDWVRFMNEK